MKAWALAALIGAANAPAFSADCPPPPLGGRDLYLRGSFNSWNAADAQRFAWVCDRFELVTRIEGEHRFKIGDEGWRADADLGGAPASLVPRGAEMQRRFDGVTCFALDRSLKTLRIAACPASTPFGPDGPARAGPPLNPVAQSLAFDSRDLAHKAPFGAIVPGTEVAYSVTAGPGVQALTLVVESRRLEGNQTTLEYTPIARRSMARDTGADGRERWSVRHRFDTAGVFGVWFEAEIGTRRFALQNNRDNVHWTREKGSGGRAVVDILGDDLRGVRRYRQTVYAADFRVPDWAADAVYYYVFPERFRNGDPKNDPVPGRDRFRDRTLEVHARWLERPWRPNSGDGSDAHYNNDFFGGDLAGIIEKLDHIAALGANVIYMTPIFRATSNHKYDTADYHQVDPAFGTAADLERLSREAARRGIRIVLDASLNHTGADSIYFDRYGRFNAGGAFEGGRIRPDSPYADWYRFDPSQADPDRQYIGWAGVADLPELDKASPSFRTFAFGGGGVMQHWLDRGAAGWRMDVVPWVSDDFWREWRKAVKAHRPDAITIAETWFDAAKYFVGDMFDSTMNYIFRNAVLEHAGGGDARALAAQLELMREHYPPPAWHALMNLLSTHDQARALHVLGWKDDADESQARLAKARYRLALFIQMTYPGAPAVYYGDEVGLAGGDDPDNRRPFPWADEGGAPDRVMLAEFRRLIALRQAQPILRRGRLDAPLHVDEHVLVLPRRLGGQFALTGSNNADEPRTVIVDLPPDAPTRFTDAIEGNTVDAVGGRLQLALPARFGRVMLGRREP